MKSQYPDEPSRLAVVNDASRADKGIRKQHTSSLRLLPLGAGTRMFRATLVVAVLWSMCYWATLTPGGL